MLLPGSCRPPRAALSSLGLLTTSELLLGAHWSPPALAPCPLEPGLWEKAAGPPTAPRDVQCQCVAVQRSVHGLGMCPAPLLPSPKLGQKREVRTAFYVQRVVPFFFGSIISDSTVHFPGKAPPEPDCASSQRRCARREQPVGVLRRLGTKRKKKKAHTLLLFALSIRQPTTPPTSFHPAKNPGKHLNSGTGGALAAGRVPLAHDTASIPWGEIWDYSEQ